jgi:predicted hydrocarbon binding protein
MVVKEKLLGKPRREALGYEVPISFVRLVLLSLEEILEENAPPTFRMLGRSIGLSLEINSIDEIPRIFADQKLGLLELDKPSEDKVIGRFQECVGCSGMEDYNEAISQFERGIVAGALEAATGATVSIKESLCCTTGEKNTASSRPF